MRITIILLSLSGFLALNACQSTSKNTQAQDDAAKTASQTKSNQAEDHKVESTQVKSAGSKYGFDLWQSAEQVSKSCEQAIATAKQHRATIKAMKTPQFGSILAEYNQLMLALDTAMGQSGLLFNTHPEQALREAAQKCEQALSAFNSELGVDRELYDRFATIDSKALESASAQAQRLYKLTIRDFKRAGVSLELTQRERIKQINDALTQLSQQFSKNVNGDSKKVEFSAQELQGLPADFIKTKQQTKDGQYIITTDYPDFFPFQKYVENRQARAKLYTAFMQRGYPANVEVLSKVLELRHEYAQLLVAETWAEYNAQDKMVGSAQTIDDFLKKLVKITKPIADQELKELLTRIQKDEAEAKQVEVWDRFYYTGKLREERHSFDAKSVRAYFPYQNVKDGVFELYGKLFGLEFKKDLQQVTVAPEVEAYTLHRQGQLIGRFFLDMHPRDNKYKHAAMFPIQTGLSTGRLPVASLVCNFPKSSDSDPGLMEHGEVTTLFHEFGHLIHHLLAQESPYARLSGINVEWDFVEAPSQLLEEWAWSHEVLKGFAKHHKTGEVIPKEMVDKMRKADEFGKGVGVMRQLFYAAYSFYLHQQDPKTLDLKAFTTDIYQRFSPYRAIEGGAVYANFGHLMGYSSMYYTYQWSLVIAKDLWTRFEKEGLLSPEVVQDYAKKVLAPGGTKAAADLAKDFLGREYQMDAYKAWLSR